jgi:hypothetical protein
MYVTAALECDKQPLAKGYAVWNSTQNPKNFDSPVSPDTVWVAPSTNHKNSQAFCNPFSLLN